MTTKIKKQTTAHFPPTLQPPQGRRSNPLERVPRSNVRFLTSKHEMDDNMSQCASIQKVQKIRDLQQLHDLSSIAPRQRPDEESQPAVEDLIKENRLKQQALLKANNLIQLLRQENSQLNRTINEMETVIRHKDSVIYQLQQQARQMDKMTTREIIYSERDKQTQRNRNNRPIASHREKQRGVRSKYQLFFQFAHSKEKDNGHGNRSLSKIVNTDHPTFKEQGQGLPPMFSKKLTPYNKVALKKEEPSILNRIAVTVLNDQIDSNRAMLQCLSQYVELQQQECQELIEMMRQKELQQSQIQEEVSLNGNNKEFESVSKILFNSRETKGFNAKRDQENDGSRQIIIKYEGIIQKYRQYSAFLRSYLCQAVNTLASLSTSNHSCQFDHHNNMFPFLKSIAHNISEQQHFRTQVLRQQNKQLKNIVQGLIKNIQLSRQPSVRPWKDYLTNSKSLQ